MHLGVTLGLDCQTFKSHVRVLIQNNMKLYQHCYKIYHVDQV